MEFVVVLLLNWKGQICQQNSTIGKGRVSVSTTSISWLRSKRGILMKMKFVDQISKGYWYANHPFRVNYKDTHSLSVWWKQYFRIQILAKFSLTYTKHICKHVQTCTAQSGIWMIEAINEKSTILGQFCSYFQRLTDSWVG